MIRGAHADFVVVSVHAREQNCGTGTTKITAGNHSAWLRYEYNLVSMWRRIRGSACELSVGRENV